MMTCPTCGETYTNAKKFCTQCGQLLPSNNASVHDQTIRKQLKYVGLFTLLFVAAMIWLGVSLSKPTSETATEEAYDDDWYEEEYGDDWDEEADLFTYDEEEMEEVRAMFFEGWTEEEIDQFYADQGGLLEIYEDIISEKDSYMTLLDEAEEVLKKAKKKSSLDLFIEANNLWWDELYRIQQLLEQQLSDWELEEFYAEQYEWESDYYDVADEESLEEATMLLKERVLYVIDVYFNM